MYDPQATCDPTPKPGAAALSALLVRTNPDTGAGGIARSCEVGPRSEHKEGRAVDWGISGPPEREAAQQALARLLATDDAGNQHLLARRMGVMYVIWDGWIWGAYLADEGWRPYYGPQRHDDHVHISLSWDGAMGHTSLWQAARADGWFETVPVTGEVPGSAAANGGAGPHEVPPAASPPAAEAKVADRDAPDPAPVSGEPTPVTRSEQVVTTPPALEPTPTTQPEQVDRSPSVVTQPTRPPAPVPEDPDLTAPEPPRADENEEPSPEDQPQAPADTTIALFVQFEPGTLEAVRGEVRQAFDGDVREVVRVGAVLELWLLADVDPELLVTSVEGRPEVRRVMIVDHLAEGLLRRADDPATPWLSPGEDPSIEGIVAAMRDPDDDIEPTGAPTSRRRIPAVDDDHGPWGQVVPAPNGGRASSRK